MFLLLITAVLSLDLGDLLPYISNIDTNQPLAHVSRSFIRETIAWGEKAGLKESNDDNFPFWQFVPTLTATVPYNGTVSWKGRCFGEIDATSTISEDTMTISIAKTSHEGVICSEFLAFLTIFSLKLEEFARAGPTSFELSLANLTEAELWDVKTKGVRVFAFDKGTGESVKSLVQTVLMFEGLLTKKPTKGASERNLRFLKYYRGIDMAPRSAGTVNATEYEPLIQDGDFLGIIRLDGLDPMLAWAMGSSTGHTTIAMRENGVLYVMESQTKSNYWPTDFVQKTPFTTWLKQAEEAGYNVLHLPLSDEVRAAFDSATALKWFQEKAEGMSYGFMNLLMGWLDTPTGNLPCIGPDYKRCLEPELVEVLFPFVVKKVPAAGIVFVQAMNQRVGTKDLDLGSVYKKAAEDKNMTFRELITVVEDDSWLYETTKNGKNTLGPAWVCDVFVCMMWKEGGIFKTKFGIDDDEINCTEFTNLDAYGLQFFNTSWPRPASCVADNPKAPFCQLTGDHVLSIDVNQFTATSHMAERCPSLGPKYERPNNC